MQDNPASTMAAQSSAISPSHDAEVISLVGFGHATSHFFHLVLPPLFPWLMPAFGLSFTEAGSLMTIFFVVSGTGQALSGFVVDRVGAHRVLLAGIGLLGVSALLAGRRGADFLCWRWRRPSLASATACFTPRITACSIIG